VKINLNGEINSCIIDGKLYKNKLSTIIILLFCSMQAKDPRMVNAPTSPALILCAISSFVSEGADPYTMS
jgi:hypothetical protein